MRSLPFPVELHFHSICVFIILKLTSVCVMAQKCDVTQVCHVTFFRPCLDKLIARPSVFCNHKYWKLEI